LCGRDGTGKEIKMNNSVWTVSTSRNGLRSMSMPVIGRRFQRTEDNKNTVFFIEFIEQPPGMRTSRIPRDKKWLVAPALLFLTGYSFGNWLKRTTFSSIAAPSRVQVETRSCDGHCCENRRALLGPTLTIPRRSLGSSLDVCASGLCKPDRSNK
jgi:hypothetical protein